MADISFVRVYPSYRNIMVDILYKSGRLYTMGLEDMPMTVRRWMLDKKPVRQYNKFHEVYETMYM